MRSFLSETIETVLLALAIFLALQASIQNFRVEGSSMEPTLNASQYILVNKLAFLRLPAAGGQRLLARLPLVRDTVFYPFHPPERGQIVVFRFPGNPRRFFVKRVIGVPGDTLELRNGRVYVNGSLLVEEYVKRNDGSTMELEEIPEDGYFLMGDNRRFSNDSRDWDFMFVPRSNIVGRAWYTYRIPARMDFLARSVS